ncbi:hypothetical protein [Gemmatimonas sp.]|uniref:hypothetical protein n=1 Tax=Gemmatimonas sp. TaxID=1962908 RepID=UPI00356992A3
MPVRLPPLTDRASRLLLEGLVDYAGLYAPAALAMPNAVRNYAHYRASGSGWILGRFICPAQSLTLFSEKADPLLPRDAGAIPWRLSVTGSPDVASDLAEIAAFNQRHRVCFDECGAKVDAYEIKVTSVGDVERIAAAMPRELLTYLEVPLDGDVETLIAAIARAGKQAKVRMGGTTADLMPSPASVVRFFSACFAHGVTAKATAGLHHPLRGMYRLTYEPDAAIGRMYGFLNVALAVAHLASGGSDAEAIQLLEEADAGRIEFSDLHVAWHGPDRTLTFTRDVLQQMRQRGLVSFGSCSFTEPVDESRALGWL